MIGVANAFISANRNNGIQQAMNGDINGAKSYLNELAVNFTGYDAASGSWNINRAIETYVPIVVGAMGSKLATAVGVNRYMRKVPFIGKYVKL